MKGQGACGKAALPAATWASQVGQPVRANSRLGQVPDAETQPARRRERVNPWRRGHMAAFAGGILKGRRGLDQARRCSVARMRVRLCALGTTCKQEAERQASNFGVVRRRARLGALVSTWRLGQRRRCTIRTRPATCGPALVRTSRACVVELRRSCCGPPCTAGTLCDADALARGARPVLRRLIGRSAANFSEDRPIVRVQLVRL